MVSKIEEKQVFFYF